MTSDQPQVSVMVALARALDAAQLPEKHQATIALAKRYASALDDDPGALGKLGPSFLLTLDALGLNRTAAALPSPAPSGEAVPDGRPPATAGKASITSLRDRANKRRGGTGA